MSVPVPYICEPPPAGAIFRELWAPLDWLRTLTQFIRLKQVRSGKQRPIMLLPGYSHGHFSMTPLKRFLRYKGYDMYDWGIGRNEGHFDVYIQTVGERVDALSEELGEPITLIGWSLGGAIAREIARLRPSSVREVITMGTPLIGGPKYTSGAAKFASDHGIDIEGFELEVHERNSAGLKQPLTVIYTKTDGVVGWTAAVDLYNRHARNICVKSTHFGLGINADVWVIIAETLATLEAPVPHQLSLEQANCAG